jgi:hypothetical protein
MHPVHGVNKSAHSSNRRTAQKENRCFTGAVHGSVLEPPLLRRFHSNEHYIPPMMTARNFSVPRKRLVQHFYLLHSANIEPAPSRKSSAALSANLPRKQTRNPFLNAVIVRFDDSFFVLIPKPDQPLLFDRSIKHRVRFHWPISQSQYFLGLGVISEISTGSNSNFGSSASGAKYAFVVFSQFLSSRSGKSGL